MAEWSGTGLQNPSRRFDSASDLIVSENSGLRYPGFPAIRMSTENAAVVELADTGDLKSPD